MATIENFEDIKGWQEARVLARLTYEVCRSGDLATDFGLKDQIRRSAASIGSNIAEGFGRGTNQEMIRFLRIAQGSAYEFRSQLYTLHDVGYIETPVFEKLHAQSITVASLIGGFLRYLEQNKTQKKKH